MEALDKALASHRAIVALNVPWSNYARNATATLETASPKLEPLGITFVAVDEESPEVRAWLNYHAIESLSGDYARGAGSFFWLEDGLVVDSIVDGRELTLQELLKRTRVRWDN